MAATAAEGQAWAGDRVTTGGRLSGVKSVDALRRRALVVADAVSVLAALACALLVGGRSDVGARLLWGLAAIPLMIVLFKLYGLYDRDMKRFTHTTVDELPWLFHATLVGVLVVWLYSKVAPLRQLDFLEVLVFGPLTVVLATLARAATRAAVGRVAGPEAALLVGEGRMARVLAAKLKAHAEYGSKVVGVLGGGLADGPPTHGLPMLGPLERLDQVVAEYRVGRVIVAPGSIDDSELEALLQRCRDLLLKVSLLPKLSDVLGPAVEIDDVEGVAVLGINPPWLPRSSRALKRVMDLVLAIVTLVLALPLLALIAIAIKLDSLRPGVVLPAAHRQRGPAVQALQAAHDDPRRRATTRTAAFAQQRSQLVAARPRPARDPRGALAAPT